MSYDLYCYHSTSGTPVAEEASTIVEAINSAEESEAVAESSSQVREKIVAGLLAHNPRLERFAFDYSKIAELNRISEEQARLQYQHAELNTPEGDLAVQLTVHGDHVFITVPYWYEGEKANQLFSELSGYLKVIRRTAGLFAYDPQTGVAFDPEQKDLSDHIEYDKVSSSLPNIARKAVAQKPWWKFW
jgi:hypothetical protein